MGPGWLPPWRRSGGAQPSAYPLLLRHYLNDNFPGESCHNIATVWGCTFGRICGKIKLRERLPILAKRGKHTLYTEQDYSDICAQIKQRRLALAIPMAMLLAGVIVSFVFRIKWLTTALSLLLGAALVFCQGMLISPLTAYRRHLDEVLHGRTRTTTGAFKEMEEVAVMRDGVKYYPMMLSVGNMDDPEDDRLFYYDANLPRPDWKNGDMLTVTAHDKSLGAWVRA